MTPERLKRPNYVFYSYLAGGLILDFSAIALLRLLDFFKTHIQSPLLFLVVLNIFLLAVGCTMGIFSALVVVVPLLKSAVEAANGGRDPESSQISK